MYRSNVHANGRVADACTTPFGIRTFEFTADKGFFLNGKHVDLKGVCLHHDQGCLGSAVHTRSIERQLEIMKSMGCNAIRTSHNPPAPELLDLCDRMGFLVMDEAFDEWKRNKTMYGYGRFFDEWSERDLTDMILRDRNHPSIVLWSIGNEIPEQDNADAYDMAKRLVDICHKNDPTRPVTSACNSPAEAEKSGFSKALDVFGVNYNMPFYQTLRGKAKLVASETASAVSTRGEYNLVQDNGTLTIKNQLKNQCSSYDDSTAESTLRAIKNSPWVAGQFVWTGFDYIGEPSPFPWPSVSSYFGIVDLCGFPKDRFYLYQSQWTDKPMVHLLPHWNWPGFEGKEIPVRCYTNCESVELFLNGKSLGEKRTRDTRDLHLEWMVPYAPGTLKAIARNNGNVMCTDEVANHGNAGEDRADSRPKGDRGGWGGPFVCHSQDRGQGRSRLSRCRQPGKVRRGRRGLRSRCGQRQPDQSRAFQSARAEGIPRSVSGNCAIKTQARHNHAFRGFRRSSGGAGCDQCKVETTIGRANRL